MRVGPGESLTSLIPRCQPVRRCSGFFAPVLRTTARGQPGLRGRNAVRHWQASARPCMGTAGTGQRRMRRLVTVAQRPREIEHAPERAGSTNDLWGSLQVVACLMGFGDRKGERTPDFTNSGAHQTTQMLHRTRAKVQRCMFATFRPLTGPFYCRCCTNENVGA